MYAHGAGWVPGQEVTTPWGLPDPTTDPADPLLPAEEPAGDPFAVVPLATAELPPTPLPVPPVDADAAPFEAPPCDCDPVPEAVDPVP
jgi:hypothetical protein